MTKRRNHSPEFKADVAMEAINGDKTLAELSTDPHVELTQKNLRECPRKQQKAGAENSPSDER